MAHFSFQILQRTVSRRTHECKQGIDMFEKLQAKTFSHIKETCQTIKI